MAHVDISEGIGISVTGYHQAESHRPLHIFERAIHSRRTTMEGVSAKPFAVVYSIKPIGYCRRAGNERSSTLFILP